MLTALYVTLLVITTLVWGYIFYKNDYHPQPFKVIVQSFIFGFFAMVPVFAYKFIYKSFLPMLAEHAIFRPILDSPLLLGIGVFTLNLVGLSLLLYILSGIVSVALNFFSHTVLINFKNAIKDEPLCFTMVSMLLGIVIYLQTLTKSFFSMPMLSAALGGILFLAIIEEYVKHLMVRITDDKKIKDIDDAITLSIMVGLAFAFIETLIYSLFIGDVNIIFYRALISLPIHLVASGIFGYYYGLAHFAKPITKLDEGSDKTYKSKWLPKILSLKHSTVYREEKMIEGTFFATIFHAVMNILFEFNLGFLTVPIIAIGLMMIFHMYKAGRLESNLIARLKKKGLRKS